ncbi:hypothetical protein BS50DRAFT_309132 [Corynespora cassiicola Philippines]|uniref:Uncharacterized protein n=1 Tax=Corynespora cassiicola Philippines TaxID=1448308 RepID=A0A2T2NXT9_CORCC|nr:hypothetical protein BS50DRAFT_309132 [Corynespora cassiicola Philippines]
MHRPTDRLTDGWRQRRFRVSLFAGCLLLARSSYDARARLGGWAPPPPLARTLYHVNALSKTEKRAWWPKGRWIWESKQGNGNKSQTAVCAANNANRLFFWCPIVRWGVGEGEGRWRRCSGDHLCIVQPILSEERIRRKEEENRTAARVFADMMPQSCMYMYKFCCTRTKRALAMRA